MSDTYTIKATIIWKFKREDYQGNNFFFAQVCEEMDDKSVEVQGVSRTVHGLFVKVGVEVEFQMKNCGGCCPDEDEAKDYLEDLLIESLLPCHYMVIINSRERD